MHIMRRHIVRVLPEGVEGRGGVDIILCDPISQQYELPAPGHTSTGKPCRGLAPQCEQLWPTR